MINITSYSVGKENSSNSNTSGSTSAGGYGNSIGNNTGSFGKLSETHTIFGQPFNGTQDVRGELTDVTSITATDTVKSDTVNTRIVDASTVNAYFVDASTMNLGRGSAQHLDVSNFIGSGPADFKDTVGIHGLLTANNINNLDTIKTKNLEVTGSAHFFELILDKVKAAGGTAIFTPADGFRIDRVESAEFSSTSNDAVVTAYNIFWQATDDNGLARENMWEEGDQALCMSFNRAKVGTSYNVSNKYYWCYVKGGNFASAPVVREGIQYNYITIACGVKGIDKDYDGVVEPEVGDEIVMLGHRKQQNESDEDAALRQSAIVISAYNSEFLDIGIKAPSIVQYTGINEYSLEGHRLNVISNGKNEFVGNFKTSEGTDIEDMINNIDEVNKPSIRDGYWYIGEVNTGIKAEGDDGKTFQLIPDTETSYVDKDKKEYVKLRYQMYEYDGTSMKEIGFNGINVYLYQGSESTPLAQLTISGSDTMSKRFASIDRTSDLHSGEDLWYKVLAKTTTGTILASRVIPTVMLAGAIFEVNEDGIEAAVQDAKEYTDGEITTVNNQYSELKIQADGISTKVTNIENTYVSESALTNEVSSQIDQKADGITLKVQENIEGKLLETGIDIESNQITLNAEQTTINGNLTLNDANQGFIIQNNGIPKIQILNETIDWDNLEGANSFRINPNGSGTGNWIGKNNQDILPKDVLVKNTTNSGKIGTLVSGDTVIIDNFDCNYTCFANLPPNGSDGNYGAGYTMSVYVLNNTTNTTTQLFNFSGTLNIEFDNPNYITLPVPSNVNKSYTVNVSEDGEYYLILECTVSLSYLSTWTENDDIWKQTFYMNLYADIHKPSTSITKIGNNGIFVNQGENQWLFAGANGVQMRWGNNGIEASDNGLRRLTRNRKIYSYGDVLDNYSWQDARSTNITEVYGNTTTSFTVDKDDDMVIVRNIQSDLNITITDADRTGRTLLFKFIQKQNTSEHTYNIKLNGYLMQKESGTVLRQTTVQLTGEKPAATVMLIGISNILYFV